MTEPLHKKVCTACEGTEKPLEKDGVLKFLSQVENWQAIDNVKISKNFKFKDFAEAIKFTNQVAEIAETEGHHPDILIHSWNKVDITLSTHAISGLSENDFIVAAKIDRLN